MALLTGWSHAWAQAEGMLAASTLDARAGSREGGGGVSGDGGAPTPWPAPRALGLQLAALATRFGRPEGTATGAIDAEGAGHGVDDATDHSCDEAAGPAGRDWPAGRDATCADEPDTNAADARDVSLPVPVADAQRVHIVFSDSSDNE